jgi:acyl carrier protein
MLEPRTCQRRRAMTTDAGTRLIVESVLHRIAPELGHIDGSAELQADLDLDSMDFLNFVTALHEETGIEIPERDYPQVATVDGCVAYLDARRERLPGAAG